MFTELVERWSGMMLRVALSHLENRALAEEIVQDAWLTVLRSLDRFERRSALRGCSASWSTSRAHAPARNAARSRCPLTRVVPPSTRRVFLPGNHPRWPHHWVAENSPWRTPEEDLLAEETRRVILSAIRALPDTQREVLVPDDRAYDECRQVFNAMHDKRPALIARCANTADVVAAMRWRWRYARAVIASPV